MKIGLSYSRCVLDIVEGRVDINDVLVVIARTLFDPHNDEQWASIWAGYGGGGQGAGFWSRAEWSHCGPEDEAKFRTVTLDLLRTGKLHQPRQFGAYAVRRPEYWLEAVLPSIELDRNPAAKDAWDKFQVIAGLANVSIDDEID